MLYFNIDQWPAEAAGIGLGMAAVAVALFRIHLERGGLGVATVLLICESAAVFVCAMGGV